MYWTQPVKYWKYYFSDARTYICYFEKKKLDFEIRLLSFNFWWKFSRFWSYVDYLSLKSIWIYSMNYELFVLNDDIKFLDPAEKGIKSRSKGFVFNQTLKSSWPREYWMQNSQVTLIKIVNLGNYSNVNKSEIRQYSILYFGETNRENKNCIFSALCEYGEAKIAKKFGARYAMLPRGPQPIRPYLRKNPTNTYIRCNDL